MRVRGFDQNVHGVLIKPAGCRGCAVSYRSRARLSLVALHGIYNVLNQHLLIHVAIGLGLCTLLSTNMHASILHLFNFLALY